MIPWCQIRASGASNHTRDRGRDDVEKIGLLGGVASRYRCNLVVNAGAANFYLYDVYEEKLEKIIGRLLDDIAEFDFVYYEGIDS